MVLDTQQNVVALAGGVGGAKLVYGLSQVVPPERFTVIGNVADDFDLYGLHISPDLDTVMYTLAGVANPATGWGVADDTWNMLDMLDRYGEDVWFRLGDRDVATHVLRTMWLNEGHTLTEITARLLERLGVRCQLLPVTDDPVHTLIDTLEHGTLGFQDYFVRHRWQPTVRRVWYRYAEQACMTDAVAGALSDADVIIFCPSNPVLSIDPLLVVPGVREAITARQGVCVAVSPFIGGKAVKGPAAKLMGELGLDISPCGLCQYYAGLLDGLVIDTSDQDQPPAEGIPRLVTQTLMQSSEDKIRLAGDVIDWVGRLVA
ncbi:MAG: 2-phospho-L-lactate transferase [Anaerolineae bacterium]|nr:2-phospho-L-lactate transferase [Anaerolineae bacterium]